MIFVAFIIVVVGVGLWLVNVYIPMAAPIKTILNVAVIIALVYWLLFVVWGLPMDIPRRH